MALHVYVPACTAFNVGTTNWLCPPDNDSMIHSVEEEASIGVLPCIQSMRAGGGDPLTVHVRASLEPENACVLFGFIETSWCEMVLMPGTRMMMRLQWR